MGRSRAQRDLSDAAAVAMAVSTAVGAWWSGPVPIWPVAALAGFALVARRPLLLVAVSGLLAAGLGARAWTGDRPVAAGSFVASATLVSDPGRVNGAVHAEVRALGHHVEVWARGAAGAALAGRAAGQRIDVEGTVVPRSPGDDFAARRHVVGRVDARAVDPSGDGDLPARAANAVRGALIRGSEALPADQRSLFAGFVLGDDRGQSVVVADDFRGAGLTHLLVVSGENVAFVLAVAAPMLRRLGPRWRWALTVALVGFFALMTRFEPSVMRATAMAAISVTAWSLGRTSSGVRILALAVTGVLLVDPLIVGVFGFQLSVAASAGIVLLARPLAAQLPVPRAIAPALGVVLAAQVAVGPLLAARVGGIPVATVPANLLAEPAAALIMAWGMTAGVLAGIVPGPVAGVLHAPTSALVWWVQEVARWGAGLPLGEVGLPGLVAAAAVGVSAVAAGRRGLPVLARSGWVAVALVLLLPAVVRGDAPLHTELAGSGTLWRARAQGREVTVVVLAARARDRDLLDGLRKAGVGRVDLLIAPSGGRTVADLLSTLRRRVTVGEVWAPAPVPTSAGQPGPVLPGATVPEPGRQVDLGVFRIDVVAVDPRLEVRFEAGSLTAAAAGVGSARAPRARSPPLRHHASRRGDGHLESHA